MYILSAEDNGHFGSFAATTPSMNALAVTPHSAAISRSQPQNGGSSRTEVVDDYFSGLNVRRHQNKLGTAISQPEEVEHRLPEQLNPLQQFVLTCAMFLAALLAHPIHFSTDVLLLTHDAPARGKVWPSESI